MGSSSDAPVARGRLISRPLVSGSVSDVSGTPRRKVRRDVCGALCRRRGLCRPGLASDAANHALQAGDTHARVLTSLPACRHTVPPRPSPHTSQLCRPRSATRCSSAWRCESFSSTTSRSAKRRRRRPSRPRPPACPPAAPLCVIPCRRPPDVLPACGPRVVARPPRSSFSRAARFSTPPSTARDARAESLSGSGWSGWMTMLSYRQPENGEIVCFFQRRAVSLVLSLERAEREEGAGSWEGREEGAGS